MRNWNNEPALCAALSGFASRLPMRNWNPSIPPRSQNSRLASRLPMRNWNTSSGAFLAIFSLPDYLWGIETPDFCSILVWKFLLPDYLWGIETTVPDYKCISTSLPDYLWGIETWRNVLCQQKSGRLPDYLWGIETFLLLLNTVLSLASRLPMRNWNSFPLRRFFYYTASRLPMRNWNSFALLKSGATTFLSFQTTYEELKLSSIFAVCGCIESFQTTYEELKHVFDVYGYTGESPASRLPMRNWNCLRERIASDYCRSFQTTYEELKRAIFCICPIRPARRLPDYLWGIETSGT